MKPSGRNWNAQERRYFALCQCGMAIAIGGTLIMFVIAPHYAWITFVGGILLGAYGESQSPFEQDK